MGARKIGPALAAGCTCVVKPAPQTPFSMLALAALLHEAGLPAGVLAVLPTTRAQEVVAACLDHPGARKLSFTGSTAVGRRLAEHAGRRLLRTSLELGGDNPFIVFDDADLDAAVEGAMFAKMRNIGEVRTAANRFLVHAAVAEVFIARLAARMAAQTVGPGLSGAEVGPLIDEAARAKVARLVEGAVAGGARLLAGGTVSTAPAGSIRPPFWPTSPKMRRSPARRCSARWPWCGPSPTRRRRSPAPTTRPSAWPPTSSPATSPAPCAWWTGWRWAWWA